MADTIAAKRIDANMVEVNFKKGGMHVETARFAVSKGGKVLTITAKGVDPKGQSFSNLVVWDPRRFALIATWRFPIEGRIIGGRWRFRRADVDAFFENAPRSWDFAAENKHGD